jgi:hypothetical protein
MRYANQFLLPPEDGRLTPETCRGLLHNQVFVKVKVYKVGYVIVIHNDTLLWYMMIHGQHYVTVIHNDTLLWYIMIHGQQNIKVNKQPIVSITLAWLVSWFNTRVFHKELRKISIEYLCYKLICLHNWYVDFELPHSLLWHFVTYKQWQATIGGTGPVRYSAAGGL